MQPYRIGIDARFLRSATGGIGRYSRELIRNIAALDSENEYVIFITEADLPEWEVNQENIHPVVVEAPHYSFKEQTVFYRELRKYGCDLVHFLNFNHPVLYRGPFVTTLHDLTLLHFPDATARSSKSRLRRYVYHSIMRRSVHRARKVIAISEYTAKDAEHVLGVSQACMEVVYEGGPDVHPLPFGNKKMVQDFLGTKDPYILFVSQWRAHKGISTLLEAFNGIKREFGLPHKLVLTGRQDAASETVRSEIANSPYGADIIMPGFAPDSILPSLYHHASVFVMPSEYEGFGLPVLEAMAYGAPCVVADNSSLPEVSGGAALLFETKNADALGKQIMRIVTDQHLTEELRVKGAAQVKSFSWKKCAMETLKVYAQILERRR